MHAKPSKLPAALRTVAFLLVLVLVLGGVSALLRGKNYAAASLSFYEEPRNSLDVLLMGSSHMLNAVSPMQLWEEHGIVSNNLAQNGQVLPVTYYHLQEALRYQRPKLIVLDIYKAVQETLIDSKASLHYTLDNMRPGLPKVKAAFDLLPLGEQAEFLLDVVAYHDRWKELTEADFRPAEMTEKGAEALFKVKPLPDFEVLPETETAPPAPTEIEYLERIVELCREEEIPLLLIAVPFATPEPDDLDRQQVVNGMVSYAQEWGVPFVNMMHHTEEMGFDYGADMADVYHANWRGMEKITSWLGAYLAGEYELPDRRGEAAYSQWEEDLVEYHRYMEGRIGEMEVPLEG